MEIKCKKCNAIVPQAEVDWGRDIATCGACGQLQAVAHLKKYMISKPNGIDESRDGDTICFRVRKMPVIGLALLLLSVVATFFILIFFIQDASFSWQIAAISVVVSLFFLGVLILMNQVVLSIDKQTLKVSNTLIPWFPKTFRRADVDQFIVHEVDIRKEEFGISGDLGMVNTRSAFSIATLKVSFKKGKQKTVVGWISMETALYLECQMEKAFEIEDWDFYNPSSSMMFGA